MTYVEQKIARCEGCGRAFSVQYDCSRAAGDRGPPRPLWLRCPHAGCGRLNAVLLPVYAYPLVVRPIPGVVSSSRT